MTQYVTDNLNQFTLNELEGGKMRIEALQSALSSVDTIRNTLAIHKEIAHEHLLNEYSDVTPGTGLFRADSVEQMTEYSITMGIPGTKDSVTYEDLMDANQRLSQRETENMYGTFLSQYKSTLSYALKRLSQRFTEAIAEASEERNAVMEKIASRSLKSRVEDGILRVYKTFNEHKTNYPLDPQLNGSVDGIDKQIAFLKKVGVSGNLASIVLNGLSYSLAGTYRNLGKNIKECFSIMSQADIFSVSESQLRSLLKWAIGKSGNDSMNFINALPVTFMNGVAFVGYTQAVLRLAFEENFERTHQFLPIVIDKETMDQMQIHAKDSAKPVHLMIDNNIGGIISKDYYFLADTSFSEKYPNEAYKLMSSLAQMSNDRQNSVDIEIQDTIRDNYSSPAPAEQSNDIEDTMYQIATETAFGVCTDAYFHFNDVCLAKIQDTNLATIKSEFRVKGIDNSVLNAVLNVGGYVQKQIGRILSEQPSWKPERDINLAAILGYNQAEEEKESVTQKTGPVSTIDMGPETGGGYDEIEEFEAAYD